MAIHVSINSRAESNREGLNLRIYVARHCLTSPEAVRLAEEVRQRFAKVHVEVIDLDEEGGRNADNICSVPAYVLDGKILYRGNPTDEDLFCSVARTLAASQRE